LVYLPMKQLDHLAVRLPLTLLCLSLMGCQSHKSVAPLGGGYEEINHTEHSFLPDPKPARTSFEFHDPDGKTIVVWPSLYSFNEVVKDGLAVFVAEKAYISGGDPSVHPRLFAVIAPAPPVDITDEVLWRWSKANGKDLTKTFSRFNVAVPEKENDHLLIRLEFWQGGYMTDDEWPDTGEVKLEWNQVSDIMDTVRKKGILQQDLRWHTPYIGEKF
jgi:hypothetical protein